MKQSDPDKIYLYDAIKIMRKLTENNFPFSFSFISCNNTLKTSSGLIKVEKSLLSKGLPRKKSEYADYLIAYEDLETGVKKHFWLPLLMTLNNLKITHDKISRR